MRIVGNARNASHEKHEEEEEEEEEEGKFSKGKKRTNQNRESKRETHSSRATPAVAAAAARTPRPGSFVAAVRTHHLFLRSTVVDQTLLLLLHRLLDCRILLLRTATQALGRTAIAGRSSSRRTLRRTP